MDDIWTATHLFPQNKGEWWRLKNADLKWLMDEKNKALFSKDALKLASEAVGILEARALCSSYLLFWHCGKHHQTQYEKK